MSTSAIARGPSSAKRLHRAAPIPLPAPVTTMLLFESSMDPSLKVNGVLMSGCLFGANPFDEGSWGGAGPTYCS